MATAGSLEALRELNRLRVIDALRQRGTASRSDIARHTGLSRTTVTTLVSDLQAKGLVVEQPLGEIQGRGRPPTLLRLDPSVGAVVGIHFDHRLVRVAVADLSSTVLPGWAGLNAMDELTARLDLQVSVDNDANLGALAEVSFGAGRGLSDVIYVMVSSGVGAGIVLDGKLHRGVTGVAGELGHVNVRADGAVCRCGNRGCLETVASTDAVLSLLRPAHGAGLTVRRLVELLDAGDAGAQRVVTDAGHEIGRVLAGLCNVLSPSGVIVGGDLGVAAGPLLNGIREALDRYALPPVRAALELRAGVLGERAEVLGALALVIGDTDRLRSAGLAALHGEMTTMVAG
jgi:predicted NBD/HSP70 family sugar kinase